jgi:transposase InsO family protein
MDMPYTWVTQSDDIPDSGSHALEGNGFDERAIKVRARVGKALGSRRTQDGSKCYPLTIIDAHSRFLIRCEVVDTPDGRAVQRIFDSAFSEIGLPATIRSDNGPPFASVGAGGLTKLSDVPGCTQTGNRARRADEAGRARHCAVWLGLATDWGTLRTIAA